MILVFAVAVGLAAGFIRARLKVEPYHPVELKHLWLVLVAALPQVLAFFLPATRERVPDQWIPYLLISTQAILLVFVWVNRREPFIWLLGIGLLLNLIVISLNGGWMPISPETIRSQDVPADRWETGARLGFSKDMIIAREDTTLWLLSDILTLPKWIPYRVAFSIGDSIIALGIIGLLLKSESSGQKQDDDRLQENIRS